MLPRGSGLVYRTLVRWEVAGEKSWGVHSKSNTHTDDRPVVNCDSFIIIDTTNRIIHRKNSSTSKIHTRYDS
jgi:hypothetical protein